MTSSKKRIGRPTADGATGIIRVNIGLTPAQATKLKRLAGAAGASAWVRSMIDKQP